MTEIFKTIRIAGWLSDREMSKGKVALWICGHIEVVIDYNIEDYSFSDDEIEEELKKAQEYADELVKQNDWMIEPKAMIDINEIELEE